MTGLGAESVSAERASDCLQLIISIRVPASRYSSMKPLIQVISGRNVHENYATRDLGRHEKYKISYYHFL